MTLGQELSLKGISFSIGKGQKVAIVGESGTGKHILIDLILGIYRCDENSGSMKIFGEFQQDCNLLEVRE